MPHSPCTKCMLLLQQHCRIYHGVASRAHEGILPCSRHQTMNVAAALSLLPSGCHRGLFITSATAAAKSQAPPRSGDRIERTSCTSRQQPKTQLCSRRVCRQQQRQLPVCCTASTTECGSPTAEPVDASGISAASVLQRIGPLRRLRQAPVHEALQELEQRLQMQKRAPSEHSVRNGASDTANSSTRQVTLDSRATSHTHEPCVLMSVRTLALRSWPSSVQNSCEPPLTSATSSWLRQPQASRLGGNAAPRSDIDPCWL